MSHVLRHEPCPACGSRDNLARYSDGHAYCFGQGCEYYERATEGEPVTKDNPFVDDDDDDDDVASALITGDVQPIKKRALDQETCEFWGYKVGKYKGKRVHIAPYYDKDGTLIAQKLRFADKSFVFVGTPGKARLFGEHLWGTKFRHKSIVITEGEIDALSVSQSNGLKFPVVSVPNGAGGALKSVKRSLDWLEQFEDVVFMFDNDDPGRNAAKECAALLSPGKARIAHLPGEYKDPNEMLQAGEGGSLHNVFFAAPYWRPDGIVTPDDIREDVLREDPFSSTPWPWEGINEMTRGLRTGELVTLTAGTGVGKSLVVRELGYHLIQAGESVGVLMLEENVRRAALGLLGIHMNAPLHISTEAFTSEEIRKGFDELYNRDAKVFFYDHFGSTDVDNLLAKVRFMANGLDCKWVILDHLSIVVSGLLDQELDERKTIDRAMTLLRTLVEETGIGMILVSHLKRPEGKGHEEGAQTSLSQLRGSAAIGQLSDFVIGLERNQQSDDGDSNTTAVRVLKNRFTGQTGIATHLEYQPETGRLLESQQVENPF